VKYPGHACLPASPRLWPRSLKLCARRAVGLFLVPVLGLTACVGSITDPNADPSAPRMSGSAHPAGPADPPGHTGDPPVLPGDCQADPTPARIWRLSDEQYVKAVGDLLPGVKVPAITTPGRSNAEFLNMAELYPVSGALAVDLRASAKAVATAAIADLPQRMACAAAEDERACGEAFVRRLATRAFRRPLDAADQDALTKLFAVGAQTSVKDGVRLSIEGVLQSPSFLYRTELGSGAGATVALTPYELASALSFFLLDSIPDPPLWQVAEDGSLDRPEIYQQQVDRLLGDPRVRENLARVFLKWSGLGGGVTTELPTDQFPSYDQALRDSLMGEATRFFGDLLAQGGTLADLLGSRRTFIDQRLATLYGVPYQGGGDFVATTLPAGERSGMLTQGAFLVSKSRGEPIVLRGKWVREELLCGDIPSPPPNINTDPPPGEELTPRQFSQRRTSSSVCGACHQLMDGIGLAFANYDPLGRFVTKDDKGAALDASGDIQMSDFDGRVNGALELAGRLGKSRQARNCVETRMLSYALGRDVASGDAACEQRRIDARIGADARLLDLLGAIALGPGFRARTEAP
jgi:hypothetical protein